MLRDAPAVLAWQRRQQAAHEVTRREAPARGNAAEPSASARRTTPTVVGRLPRIRQPPLRHGHSTPPSTIDGVPSSAQRITLQLNQGQHLRLEYPGCRYAVTGVG